MAAAATTATRSARRAVWRCESRPDFVIVVSIARQARIRLAGPMADYIAFIHKDRTPGYLVTFPDLPGLAISARTLDGVWREAKSGLAIHLKAMVEHGEAVPAPSTIDMLARADGYKDAVAVVAIHVSDIAAPTVCVNIVLSEAMLRRIDERAAAHGCTRSGFLVEAALKALEAA